MARLEEFLQELRSWLQNLGSTFEPKPYSHIDLRPVVGPLPSAAAARMGAGLRAESGTPIRALGLGGLVNCIVTITGKAAWKRSNSRIFTGALVVCNT